MRFFSFSIPFSLLALTLAPAALAQQPYPPQQYPPPQYPPGQYPPPQYPPQQYPPQQYPPQQYPPPGYYPPPQAPAYYPPPQRPLPPPVEPPDPPTHAPKFSLWAGPRLSYLGFGYGFYSNSLGNSETTGNFLGNGVATQLDVGARISHRYIPFLFWQHGFMSQGHRFEGSSATSSTDLLGIGFRFLSGDVDTVAFATELSFGKRIIHVSNGNESYSMSGLEIFGLGLGAEIRLATLFTIEPMLSVSGGEMSDTSGNVTYSTKGSGDGVTHPDYNSGATIGQSSTYIVLSLGVGVHFDVFGK